MAFWVVLSGCSLRFDFDQFQTVKDAAVAPDVDVTQLAIDGVEPTFVVEGSGCLPTTDGCDGNSRGTPVLVKGAMIASNAEITVTGERFGTRTYQPAVEFDGSRAAFALAVPVLPTLGSGETEILTITVSQADGTVTSATELELRGLDEWVAGTGSPTASNEIAPEYSQVVVDVPVDFSGMGPIRLVATAEIRVEATIRANADGTASGPGGCTGGSVGADGSCGGGGQGKNGGAGGGGGFSESGKAGQGQGNEQVGGKAGDPRPVASLIPLPESRGGGGGGGSTTTGLLNGNAAPGGGSGGVLELSSGGRLAINADIEALGANGGNATKPTLGCATSSATGAGGGGAGGAVLLRARLALDIAGSVDVGGGSGGSGGCNDGGDGSAGRARIDAPTSSSVPSPAAGSSFRGAMLDPSLPAVLGPADTNGGAAGAPIITVFGPPRADISVRREGAESVTAHIGSDRIGTVQIQLEAGHNTLCTLIDPAEASLPEAVNCLDVVYLP